MSNRNHVKSEELDICGFFMRDEPAFQPPEDLANFLALGPPPIYVGFGSIVIQDPKAYTEIILESCRRAGVRVIISRGWSKLGGNSPNTDDVFYLGDCPHGASLNLLFYSEEFEN